MKKIALFLALAFVLGVTVPSYAQIDQTKKGIKTAKKHTNRGLHKGWTVGKRVGKKTWRKGKSGTKKTVKVVKDAVN